MIDESRIRLGPGVYRVSTVQDPMADSAYYIYTQSTTSDATLYLTLVNSNNTPASKETVYTNYGLTYNPLIANLSIGSSIQISPERLIYTPTSFYIGNGSNVGITSFSGKIRLGGNSILSSSGDTAISFDGTNTEFIGNVTVLGNFNTSNIIAGIVTATRFLGDGSQLTGIVAGSSYASTAGIATVAQGLTGTPNLVVGIVTATRFLGDGSQLTGISVGSGIVTYAQNAGISTVSGYATSSGVSSASQSLLGTPNLIVGIVTASSFIGDGSQLTGISVGSGIVTYSNVAGIATYSNTAGLSTSSGYSNSSGIASASQSLIGTPNLVVGIVTASRIIGDGSQLTGIFVNSPYANNAGIATVAQGLTGTPNIIAGIVTASSFIGDGSQLTGISTNSLFANVAGISTISGYAASSGISTTSQGLVGTPNLVVGIVTATRFLGDGSQLTGISTNSLYANIAGYSTYSGIATVSSYALSSGVSTYSNVSGISTAASYSTSSGISTISGYSSSAGIATVSTYSIISGIATVSTYSIISGIATVAQGLTGTPNLIVGIVTASSFIGDGSQLTGISVGSGIATYANVSGYSTSSGIATYSNGAGISTISGYANIAGLSTISDYSTSSGISTISGYSSSAGIATVSTYSIISGIATVAQGLTGTPNLIVGIVTASSFIGDGSQLTGISTNSLYASVAGISTYSNTSGISTVATYAVTSGISTISQGLTGTPNLIVGIVTATSFLGDGSQLTGISTVAGTNGQLIYNNAGVGSGATPTGGLSIQNGNLVYTEGIALVISNRGEVATAGLNYVEKAVDRACTVVGVTWELNPTATSTSGSSLVMLYTRRSGTKTSLLTTNASLPATTGIFTNVSGTLTGNLALTAGDTLGGDLIQVGTGASGLILTVYIRYS